MTSILVLGVVLGMRHALEADHLAAVATLARSSHSLRAAALRGAAWGLGHSVTLLLIGGVCLLLNAELPERLMRLADVAVGVMLMGLGVEVFWRMRRQGVHVHAHEHGDGTLHMHAHVHDSRRLSEQEHDHPHPEGFPRRALLVGLVHGMAGSAALLLLTLHATGSLWLGLLYIGLFGIGSILGMAALSIVIAIPLRASAHLFSHFRSLYQGLHGAVGGSTALIGLWILVRAAMAS